MVVKQSGGLAQQSRRADFLIHPPRSLHGSWRESDRRGRLLRQSKSSESPPLRGLLVRGGGLRK
jgi:hypothetical protein